jgi:hypothetical protein
MNIEVNFDSVNNVITNLEAIKTNIETCYGETLSLTSYEGSKKEDIEGFINNCLVSTGSNINSMIDSIISDIKKINGMYDQANLENKDTINILG